VCQLGGSARDTLATVRAECTKLIGSGLRECPLVIGLLYKTEAYSVTSRFCCQDKEDIYELCKL